jgi:hypothetical protein
MDWANAAYHVFQALQRYGLDATLINLQKRGLPFPRYEAYYNVAYWTPRGKENARRLIEEADIYHIFESGGTISLLKDLNLKKKPRIISLNTSKWYRGDVQPTFNKIIKPHGHFFTALTMNMPINGVALGLQPLPSDRYPIRQDYSLKGKILTMGGAPGYRSSYRRKKYDLIKKRLKKHNVGFDIVMNATQKELKTRIQKKHDIFTNGIGLGSCGYSMLQGAMSGLPCLSYVKDRDKEKLSMDGVFPILEMGRKGEHIGKIIKLMQSKENRRHYGQLAARWARKYQSYRACYETYLKFYQNLLGR